MKASRRELKFAAEHFGSVHHTTLNPEGPGVVRIHFIPAEPEGKYIPSGTAIINGQDLIPVNVSWSILLCILTEEINVYSGKPINEAEADVIVAATCKRMKSVYPLTSKKRLARDIYRIMNAFSQIARGKPTEEEIGYVSIGDYAPYMKAPHRMDLMVSAMTKNGSWHCNQRCVHCYAAGQSGSSEEEMPTERWKAVIDKCRLIKIPQVTFTGGEPTMREDLFELIEHAKWFVTRLNTNGIKLTREYCESLKRASLDSVQITFYSSDKDVHNKLVGADGYDRTAAGIDNAIAAGLNVSVNTPLCVLNRDYVKTLEFLRDKGVIYVTCSGLITTGNAELESSSSLQLSREEMSRILSDAAEFCFKNGMEISFTSPGWVEPELCRELGLNTPCCGACLSNMAISPGGNVVPCQSWLSGPVLGSFLDSEWSDIWNGDDCVRIRENSAAMSFECPLRKGKKEGK